MTNKIRLLNTDGSLHGEYEFSSAGSLNIRNVFFDINELKHLGFKIEEVEEKRREFWIDEDLVIYDSETDCPHFVELNPHEKILSREQVRIVSNKFCSMFTQNILRELGFEV